MFKACSKGFVSCVSRLDKKKKGTQLWQFEHCWDAIAKKLHSIVLDQGIPSYCTGRQCKACIKCFHNEYKRVKDHNSRSGNNQESLIYYDEIDEVLGFKLNIMPKQVVKFGLAEVVNATAVGDS